MTTATIKIYLLEDDTLEEVLEMDVPGWMDSVDVDCAGVESAINWASRNGYSYDDEIYVEVIQ